MRGVCVSGNIGGDRLVRVIFRRGRRVIRVVRAIRAIRVIRMTIGVLRVRSRISSYAQ